MRLAAVALLLAATAACDIVDPPPPPSPQPTPSPVTLRPIAPERPIGEREAAALSREFGLRGCSDIVGLRDGRADGLFGQSWRVRSGDVCFGDWADRQERYAILAHLDGPQARRDALPWLCGETGGHVAECTTQRREPMLVIEQPRGADYLLLRRITKESR